MRFSMPFHGSLRLRIVGSSLLFAALAIGGAETAGYDVAATGADAARAIAGDRAVATLEDLVYGARDAFDQVRHDGQRPAARWSVPEHQPEPAVREARPEAPSWNPPDVGPMYGDFAAEGDGIWVPLTGDGRDAVMKKTLVHPDRARPLAELFVVAVDITETRLHYVAGTTEPENIATGADAYRRQGEIPRQDREVLLAAFNGGFKTRHGQHGVEIDGVTLVPMRPALCTLVGNADGSLLLGPFRAAPPREGTLFVRQTARCLVEDGVRHPGLVQELTASWGAAVGGDTVIRRSAIGLGADRRTLFVGVSNRTTATALADGMRHAGATTAAQLDVNEAFPRFLTYKKNEKGALAAESIAPGFHYRAGHYLDADSSRDFFYVTKKPAVLVASTDRVHAAGGS
jgi:hypothetical protein